MGLLSIFQRGNRSTPPNADGADPVQAARTRARHRLIGAAVLVIAGVIGFPLVFETQPRPIPVDIPIEIPKRDAAPALSMPSPKPVTAAKAPAAPASAAVAAPRDDIVTETRAEAGREVTSTAAPTVAPKAASAAVAEAPKKSAEDRSAVAAVDAARAKALLDGKDPKPAAKAPDTKETKDGGRFVVQVGAFADAGAARETRTKAEKLGLKTYTQVVDTASGSRTRVRIGPFASREEAEKAVARAKDAGLNAVVLTL